MCVCITAKGDSAMLTCPCWYVLTTISLAYLPPASLSLMFLP